MAANTSLVTAGLGVTLDSAAPASNSAYITAGLAAIRRWIIEEVLSTILENDAGVGALCGDRIYPQVIPQGGTVPAVTYDRTSGERIRALDGVDGVASPRFEFICWAATYLAAVELKNAVRAALEGYTGTILGVSILFINLTDTSDIVDASPGQANRRRFGRRMNFDVWHTE